MKLIIQDDNGATIFERNAKDQSNYGNPQNREHLETVKTVLEEALAQTNGHLSMLSPD